MVVLKGKDGKSRTRRRLTYTDIQKDQPRDANPGTKRVLRGSRNGGTNDTLLSLGDKMRKKPNSPYEKIEMLLDLGRLKEAEDCCLEALAQNKDIIRMHEKMAEIRGMTGRLADSISHYDTAIQLCKRMGADNHILARIYNNKAVVLIDMDKFDEALDCFDLSIKAYPDEAMPYGNKGVLLYRMKKRDDAIRCFVIARQLDPDFVI